MILNIYKEIVFTLRDAELVGDLWDHLHWLDKIGMEETSDYIFASIMHLGKEKKAKANDYR